MTVTCGIAHGWCTGFFVQQETLSHGSNAFLEILCQLLDKVAEICRATGRRFPQHLVIQTDNTVAQTKNSHAAAFCSQLVGAGKFSTVTLNFLMVGHTHEDVDQLFGIITELVVRKHRWETPAEFERILLAELTPHVVDDRDEVIMVRGLSSIRDFESWLAEQAVSLYGCWGNRDGLEAPHSFAFKRRNDLSAVERSQVHCTLAERRAGYGPVNASGDDVYCCVKAYMRDKRLQQAPVLVLPCDRRDRVIGNWPTTAEAVNMSTSRAAQLERLATVLEATPYMYTHAARALRALAGSVVGPLAGPGWLAEAPVAQPPVVDYGNEYFGHLPDISWHMLARFHNL